MEPSDDTTFIIQAARKCLEQIYSKGYKYHKAGIMLLDLVPSSYKQMEMFDTEETQARSKLMKNIDVMNIFFYLYFSFYLHKKSKTPYGQKMSIEHQGIQLIGMNW